MPIGIILVHGYTGSPSDLMPLYNALARDYGSDSVTNLCLPGHDKDGIPDFDKEKFTGCVKEAVEYHKNRNAKIIFLGHSTGGNIILSYLLESLFVPQLAVLACTPNHIDATYLKSWNDHRPGKGEVPLTSLARMISSVNSTGSSEFAGEFPVLIIHGNKDELVPLQEAYLWKESFGSAAKLIEMPGGRHNIFSSPDNNAAIELISRHISSVVFNNPDDDIELLQLLKYEPRVKEFLDYSGFSSGNIKSCPSAQRLLNKSLMLRPVSEIEPVFANIEITSRCNLSCRYCARTLSGKKDKDMKIGTFKSILSILHNTYKIMLVGLGEPLLNPDVADFIKEAAVQHRWVGIVTNAMYLNEKISSQLIQAGLNSITFSIDTVNQSIADNIRNGSNISVIIDNIKKFMDMTKGHASLSSAVFCAVSVDNILYLEELADAVAGLGVNALVLTDLNFERNAPRSVWKNGSSDHVKALKRAIAKSFSMGLPVLGVHSLEEFGLAERYRDFLLFNPGKLAARSGSHLNCLSLWQTIAIDVDGNVSVCDCQPDRIIGNVLEKPLNEIWNCRTMKEQREKMLSPDIPRPCSVCPRF